MAAVRSLCLLDIGVLLPPGISHVGPAVALSQIQNSGGHVGLQFRAAEEPRPGRSDGEAPGDSRAWWGIEIVSTPLGYLIAETFVFVSE